MKIYFLNIIFIFFPLTISLKNETNVILIDFTESLLEVDINPMYDVEMHSTKQSKWIISRRLSEFNDVIFRNRQLLIKRNNQTLIRGNISVCQQNDEMDSVNVTYDIPTCCPCCSWYNIHLCKSFYKKVENCTTIILYNKEKRNSGFNPITVYENDIFLLPCQMRLSNFKDDLSIGKFIGNKEYIKFNNGSLVFKYINGSYNPTSGLCLHSSELEEVVTYIRCTYRGMEKKFSLTKVDYNSVIIRSYLLLKDKNNKFLYINDRYINVLHETKILIQCIANYSEIRNANIMICINFEEVNQKSFEYDCVPFANNITKELRLDTNKIRNGSTIICSAISPSRENSAKAETKIYKYQNEKLAIKNFKELNNKIFTISEEEFVIEIFILYSSIPSDNNVNCSFEKNSTLKFEISCSITIVEQCLCRINTEKIIQQKTEISLTISIGNEKFKESVAVFLKPIYLEKPIISGLISKMENFRQISCDFNASKPFNIIWDMEYNKKSKFVHKSVDTFLNLIIYNDTEYICVTCQVENNVGKMKSEKVCKGILDAEIHDSKILQIFVVNVILWTGEVVKKKEIQFLDSKNQNINILDSQPLFIKCASRNKYDEIDLYLNNVLFSLRNIVEKQSKFTRQIITELDVNFLSTYNSSLKFLCRQKNISDSTYFINILKTRPPYIRLHGENNQKFQVRHDIHIKIDLDSFPLADIKLFKMIKLEMNNSYYRRQLKKNEFKMDIKNENKILSIITIIFENVSRKDSGKYSIIASNIRGSQSYQFLLEELEGHKSYFKVSIILGSLIIFVIICLLFVIFYCKRSGYAIPIIQIQNNIYKSLDGDSLHLLNTIWPDPLERIKWTIKPSSRIKVKERIGGGNYGVVYTGIFKIPETSSEECVALKYPILTKPINNEKPFGPSQFCQISLDCFINEIRILSQLTNCPNIIKMYGCAIFRDWINEKDGVMEPTTVAVLEYCSNFSLSEFLSENALSFAPYTKYRKFTLPNGYTGMKMDEGLTLLDLKRITLGIATGLEYLHGLNIVHRDLAARNILIDEKKSPKICDFGLAVELDNDFSESKSYQILTYNKALPYKILGPEALEFKTFYLESDIWSFSLLIWDIFNLAKEILFPNINTPSELLRYISSKLKGDNIGFILPMPRYSDESIWDMIKNCWYFKPFDRPSAHTIRNQLVEIVRNSPVEVIRVSSCCQSDIYNQTCQESLASSKFPSTHTSLITLNTPTSYIINNDTQSFGQCNDVFRQVDESLL